MATQYNHSAIEKKWRENWEEKPINGRLLPDIGIDSRHQYGLCRKAVEYPPAKAFLIFHKAIVNP